MTLILSGGGLGFLAGLVQQLLSTGSISVHWPKFSFGSNATILSLVGSVIGMYAISVAIKPRENLLFFATRLIQRTRRLKKRTYRYLSGRRHKEPSREEITTFDRRQREKT